MSFPHRGRAEGVRQRRTRAMLRSSWQVVRDLAYGIDNLNAVRHGTDPAPRTVRATRPEDAPRCPA